MCTMTVCRIIKADFLNVMSFFFSLILRRSILELIKKCARCACANNPPLSIFYGDLRGVGMCVRELCCCWRHPGSRDFTQCSVRRAAGFLFQLFFFTLRFVRASNSRIEDGPRSLVSVKFRLIISSATRPVHTRVS